MWILDLGTLSALASNGNTLYHVMGVKRNVMPVDLLKTESVLRDGNPIAGLYIFE